MARTAQPLLGWWGARFQQYLLGEELLYEPLTRSQIRGAERSEARLFFERGVVVAHVGTSFKDTATLKVKPLTDRDWKKALDAITSDADVARRLLSGTPGPELELSLRKAGVELFPGGGSGTTLPTLRCDCYHQWECRHMRVLAARAALLLDTNPFLWLEVLGRPREDVLAAVRAHLSDRNAASQGEPVAAVLAERFLTTELDPDSIPVRPGATVASDALLKLLGPLPLPEAYRHLAYYDADSKPVKETADDVVARYLARITRMAASLATGETPADLAYEAPAGKRVPPKHRLVEEIQEAADRVDGLLGLSDLYELCPTAAGMTRTQALPALLDALSLLQPEYVHLAQGFVGRRAAVLTGITFRHIITFREWQRGRLSSGTDWERLLALVGCKPPFEIRIGGEVRRVLDPEQAVDDIFAHLRPEVGDHLTLTVVDPEGPHLVGQLQPRSRRSGADLTEADRAAAQTLARFLDLSRAGAIQEAHAVEVLLAYGFYREGATPDPVWLLPAASTTPRLYWGRARSLVTQAWYRREPVFGRGGVSGWTEKNATLGKFTAALAAAGWAPREIETAINCVDVWCRFWPGDQRDRRGMAPVGALLHFLWIAAPSQLKLAGERTPTVLDAWFRFLEESYPALQGAYREHLQGCELVDAYRHRLLTLPADKAGLGAWQLAGYRWLGPEIVLGE